jgi:hypothetical protein
VHAHELQNEGEPEMVPLDAAIHIPAPIPRRHGRAASRGQQTIPSSASGTIDAAIRECVRSTVVAVVREELAEANRARDAAEADQPRPAAWWAEQLGCSAESLVKRVKRGSLQCVKIGARYYFTRAQIDGSRRWQRTKKGCGNDA